MIAIDTETTLIEGNDAKVRTRYHVPTLVCLSYAQHGRDRRETESGVVQGAAARSVVVDALASGQDLVFHNAAFDLGVLAATWPELDSRLRTAVADGRVLDTRVLFSLIWPDYKGSRSLENAVRQVLGVHIEKGVVRTSFRPDQTLTQEQRDYAERDAIYTLQLADELLRTPYGGLSTRPDTHRPVRIECSPHTGRSVLREFCSAAAALAWAIEPIGLGVDAPAVRDEIADLEREAEFALANMAGDGLARFVRQGGTTPRAVPIGGVPDSVRPLTRTWAHGGDGWMYRRWKGSAQRVPAKGQLDLAALRRAYTVVAARLGLRPAEPGAPPLDTEYPTSAKTGGISLEYKFWKRYASELPDGLVHHLHYGKATKLLSTYLRPLAEAIGAQEWGRVHPSVGIAMAETGRWTCWRPNLQNQPKALRGLYVAPEGSVYVTSDYKSLEMYTLCEALHQLGLGNGPLRKVLDAGGDTHAQSAALLFQRRPEEVTPEQRKAAKVANFALAGGLGPRKFATLARAAGLEWTLTQATEMRTRWLTTFWDVAAYLDQFRVNVWDLKPAWAQRAQWLEWLGLPTFPWPSRFEISRKLSGLFECVLPSGRVIPNRGFSQAANVFFQGLGAEVVTLAVLNCFKRGLRVAIAVHDSITIEARESAAESVKTALRAAMLDAQRLVCQCGVALPEPEIEVGRRWS